MKKKKDYLKIITTFVAVCVYILVMISLVFSDGSNIALKTTPHAGVSIGWTNLDTGEEETREYVKIYPGGALRLSRTLPENLNDDNVLGYYDYGFRVVAFIDGEEFYSIGENSYGKFGTEISQAWRSIPLKADYSGRTLTVIWENDTDATMRIYLTGMQITYASSEIVRSITTSWGTLLIILICFILSLGILVFSFILKKFGFEESRHIMLMLGMMILSVGFWSWANSSLCQLLFSNASFGYKLAYLSYPLIPLFLGMFYERVYKDKNRIFYGLNATYRISLVLIYICYLTDLVPLSQALFMSHVYLFVDLLLGTIYGISGYLKNRTHGNHWAMLGQWGFLMVSVIFIPMYYLTGMENVFLYAGIAAVFFCICMLISQGVYSVNSMNERRKAIEVHEQTKIDRETGENTRMGMIYLLEETDFTKADAPWFVLMKLTNFAAINELFSWKNSKKILHGIYTSNEELLVEGDYQATVGEGEFAFLLPAEKNIDRFCADLAQKLKDYMVVWNNPFLLPRFSAVRVNPGDDLSKLLACAHLAYIGKNRGNIKEFAVNYYDYDCADRIMKGQVLEDAVARAIRLDEMQTVFKPVVDLTTGKVTEADIRLIWHEKAEGNILANASISGTERDALEVRMNALRVSAAMEFMASHTEFADTRIAVFIYYNCLVNDDFWASFNELREKLGLPLSRFDFELPENIGGATAARLKTTIAELRSAGAMVTMKGYDGSISGLKLIRELQADRVRLSKALFEEENKDEEFYERIAYLVRQLHDGGQKAYVPYVEDNEEMERLKAVGVDLARAQYLYPQVKADDFVKMMKEEGKKTV